jgi:hypothetical protein
MGIEVEFKSLVGQHKLTGVDNEQVRIDGDWDDANVLRFVLNGKIYVATENPDDGYRSSLRSLEIVDGPPVKNTFKAVRVEARISDGRDEDVLELVDMKNGEVILRVGTENCCDYYPSFVADFMPDRMAVNAKKKGKL